VLRSEVGNDSLYVQSTQTTSELFLIRNTSLQQD